MNLNVFTANSHEVVSFPGVDLVGQNLAGHTRMAAVLTLKAQSAWRRMPGSTAPY